MTETAVDWDAAAEESEFTGNTMPRGSRPGTSRARASGRRVSDKRLSALQEKLSSEMFQAGAMIGLGLPVTGYYIAQESGNFTNAIVTLASRNSNWVAALESIALVGPGIAVGRTVLGIGAAMAADRYWRSDGESGLNPEKRSAMFLGVTAAYYAVHPPEGYTASQNGDGNGQGSGNFTAPPHSGFSPLG